MPRSGGLPEAQGGPPASPSLLSSAVSRAAGPVSRGVRLVMTRFGQPSLSATLGSGFTVLIVLLAVLGLGRLASLTSVDAGVTKLNDRIVPGLTQIAGVTAGAEAVRSSQYQHVAASTAAGKAEVAVDLAHGKAAVALAFARYKQRIAGSADHRRFDAVRADWRAYLKRAGAFLAPSRRHDARRAVAVLDAASSRWDSLEAALAAWSSAQRAEGDRVAQSSHSSYRRSGTIALAVIALAVLIAAALAFALERALERATGSSETEVEEEHGLELAAVIVTPAFGGERAADIASAVSTGAAPQPPAAAEADQDAPAPADGTTDAAERTRGTEELAGAPPEDDPAIDVSGVSERLDRIVVTVTDLAERTNLLALHAAVQADGAGEQRRGFAVVADGIRTLADSYQAAEVRISDRIREVQAAGRFDGIDDIPEILAAVAGQTYRLARDAAAEAHGNGKQNVAFADVAAEIRKLADDSHAADGLISALTEEIHAGGPIGAAALP